MNELKINIEEKKYSNTTILQSINLKLNKAGIYGIIGKNGAGKTTLFKSITKETDFTGGIYFNQKEIQFKKVGYLPTEPFLYEELKVKEFYDFYFQLVNSKKLDLKSQELLFPIDENKFIKSLSTGMRKKVALNSLFFQKDIDFYIFDEPFNGLDIESNLALIKKIQELSQSKIILISSHILSSLYEFCNEIYLIQNKKIERFEKEEFNTLEDYFISNINSKY
ncbi:MAG: ABC transporter ATP-binding protein [Flavobacteriales bacterium]|nr:ABC transporter ATP-binding protein [Flavobacteriales bacterium]